MRWEGKRFGVCPFLTWNLQKAAGWVLSSAVLAEVTWRMLGKAYFRTLDRGASTRCRISWVSSPAHSAASEGNKRDSVEWRNQPRRQLDVRLIFTDLTASNLPHRDKYIDYAQGFGPICSFFFSSAVCYKTIFINHCELLTVRIKKVKPASSEIISFIFFYSSMLFLFIWFFFVAF